MMKILCVISVIVCVCVVASENERNKERLTMSFNASRNKDLRDDNHCGANVIFTLSSDTLIIQGSGNMSNYDDAKETPWYNQRYLIKKIQIELGVESVGNYAFGETAVTQVSIPSSVTSIGMHAFINCNALNQVTLPSSVSSVGKALFYGCSSLQSIGVDSSSQKYSSNNGVLVDKQSNILVAYPPGKTSTSYTIPSSIITIADSAFIGCSHLQQVTVPEGVQTIEQMGFLSCSVLVSISLPSSLVSIDSYAFKLCSELKTITIPESVTSIGFSAFDACSQLNSVYYQGSTTIATSNIFNNCGSLNAVCVSPDYNSTKFGGRTVDSTLQTCVSFRNKFNHCYKGAFDKNGDVISEKRRNTTEWESQSNHCYLYECVDTTGPKSGKRANATQWEEKSDLCFEYRCNNESGGLLLTRGNASQWEDQTNGCIEYQCDNEKGYIWRTLCYSTEDVHRSCVDGLCKNESSKEKPWTVEIGLNEPILAVDLNNSETKELILSMTGIDEDIITVGLVIDESGFTNTLLLFVDEEEIAQEVADVLKVCMEN